MLIDAVVAEVNVALRSAETSLASVFFARRSEELDLDGLANRGSYASADADLGC